MFTAAVLLILVPGAVSVYGQERRDTLQEVQVITQGRDTLSDLRKAFTAGMQVQAIERQYRELYHNQSLATLLAQQTPVFVKSYGINGMASLSIRGASAAQSSVLWNGVPILNPALGVADVSVLSTGLFDNISLQYGSSSALYGSGNVGGALLLEQNDPSFGSGQRVKMTLGAGSFGRRDIALSAQWRYKRWLLGFRTFYQRAVNDFKYENRQQEEQRLDNARLEAGGALLYADYNLSKSAEERDHTLSLQLWYQCYDREIPPALFEQYSVKRQQDVSYRSLLHWRRELGRSHYYAKASLNREELHYEDGVVLPDNRNHVYQYYQELGWRYDLSLPEARTKHSLLLSVPLQYAVAEGQNISNAEHQFRPALVAAYRNELWHGRLKTNVAVRQEWINGDAAPLLPGAGAEFGLFRKELHRSVLSLALRANIQRTYRVPTLNELYYFPGGNRSLKPEQGWNEDGGYTFQYLLRGYAEDPEVKATHQLHVFNRNIHDWIYWLGGAIWTPYNIAEVHSRGMETDNDISWRKGRVTLHAGLKYVYVLSTTVSSYLPNDGSAGKQIPYAPRYNGQANAGLSYGGFFLNYNHTYTGYRFVTVDESQYLEPYQTGNVQAVYTLHKGDYMLRFAAQVQNVWNVRYQVVNARPMPGRYWLCSLQIGWSH